MKKKRLLIAGLCMMVAIGVSGCGNTAEKNSGSAAEEVKKKWVKTAFFTKDARHKKRPPAEG